MLVEQVIVGASLSITVTVNEQLAVFPLTSVTAKLLVDGIASFQKSFDELIAGLESKIGSLTPGK